MKTRLIVFLTLFSFLNLLFVPLLSVYGLRVCPVLSVPGFSFGCYYSGIYILLVNLLNLGLVSALNWNPGSKFRRILIRHPFKTYFAIYLIATASALAVLQSMLHNHHLSAKSRAPEILVLASMMLGIIQVYGLNWAQFGGDEVLTKPESFQKRWLAHVSRTLFPIVIALAVLLHFLISQSLTFNLGRTAPILGHDALIEQISYLAVFLFGWMGVVFTFHFLAERDYVLKVQTHLARLEVMDTQYRSALGQAWGLWAAILTQLNSFSKILGERARLLSSFSRFVTSHVAEKALQEDLIRGSGVQREMTVIMTDIRDFTGISETLAPSQVVQFLNEYFTAMLDVMATYSVMVDKFIGDGILAYVDLPESDEPNSTVENTKAVEAALAMLARIKKLNESFAAQNLPPLKIGVGIYRGPLVLGLIGSESKLQQTIIGDTVNRAARLESLTKELSLPIIIDSGVFQSLSSDHRALFQALGLRQLKGLKEPIEIFGGPTFT